MRRRLQIVGSRLASLRRDRGLTQEVLAERSGVGIATIRRIEGGTGDPRLSTLVHLADALAVPLPWLVVENQPKESSADAN